MMAKGRIVRWLVSVGGSMILLQAGTCALNDPQVREQIQAQFVLPQVASLLSDFVFFVLDNALVRLTT